jgi:hypothetical protein
LDSKDSSKSYSEESSESEGSTNDCDEAVNVCEGEAVQLLQSLNGNSSADDEVNVGLKGRSNAGIVEGVVQV